MRPSAQSLRVVFVRPTIAEPPTPDVELPAGWLERALRTLTACADPGLRLTVRCAGEIASIVDGNAMPGTIEGPQAVIDGDPGGFYHLIVDGDLSGVEIDGDPAAVVQLAGAFAVPHGQPQPAAV